MSQNDILTRAREVFDIEINGLQTLRDSLGEEFSAALRVIDAISVSIKTKVKLFPFIIIQRSFEKDYFCPNVSYNTNCTERNEKSQGA